MTKKWQKISLEMAKAHPLYGIKGWLLVFAIGNLLGFLSMIGSLRGEAYKAGISELDLLGIDHPNTTYFKITLFLTAVSLVARYYLLFTKHPQFRKLVSILLLIDWPVAMCLALALGVVGIVGPLITTGLISWGISCAVWVTYMQKSKRVRVTFENCIEEVELKTANIVVPVPKMADVYPVNSPRAIPLPASSQASNFNQPSPPSQPLTANFATSATTASTASDDLWAQALTEYESSSRNQGLWARLFSESQGNETLVKANYLRIRVDEMQQVLTIEKTRLQAVQKTEAAKVKQARLLEVMTPEQREYDALPKGICPNCQGAILSIDSNHCPKCWAQLGPESRYKAIIKPISQSEQINALRLIASGGTKLTDYEADLLKRGQ